MPKPSIFSNRYDEQMRKRKRNRGIFIISVIIIVLIIFSGIVKNILSEDSPNEISNAKTQNTEKQKNHINKTQEKSNKDIKKDQENNGSNKEYIIKLDNGKELKLLYNIVNNQKIYTDIIPNNIKYSISPSKNNMVIMEDEVQKIVLVDENGKSQEITKPQYISTRGERFNKEEIIKLNASYIWCDKPKFLDDDNIVYVSQLPWFNKPDIKYLWKYNISSNTYTNNFLSIGEVSGNNIEYGKLTDDGLEIIIDGIKKIIK